MDDFTDDHEALVLATLAQRVKARQDAVKAVVGQRYPDGHRETVRSPLDGEKLGQIYRTDPDPTWVVSDMGALLRALDADDSDAFEIVAEVLLPSGEVAKMSVLDELYQIVAEHAPHLTRAESRRIRPGIVDDLLAQSRQAGAPVAPGIAKVKAGGVLTVKPDKAAADVVGRLVAAGAIDWQGRPALTSAEQVA